MIRSTPAARLARFIIVLSSLLLPTLSLIPLGGLYLWQNGYLLIWALASFAVIGSVSAIELWLLRRPTVHAPMAVDDNDAVRDPDASAPDDAESANAGWNATERAAWDDVLRLARRVDIDRIDSLQAFVDLGGATVEVVARRLHPGKADAAWQFTIPEAMAIAEQVSRRLSWLVDTHVPFGDRLTLAQVRTAYGWRGAIDVAERAYDIWRIVRLANPATAVTHEARERLSRALMTWGREQVTRRIAESYIEEVGRAAIELYGGRLRQPAALALVKGTAGAAAPDVRAQEPMKRSVFQSGRQAIAAAARGTGALFRSRRRR